MENLISFQNNLLNQVNNNWHRYLFKKLASKERLLGLKGLRGVGKTTLLLQYLAHGYPEKEGGLYVTMDHPYFYKHSLFELASDWYREGGKLLLIDEVHKYANWSRELKLIYDGHPELQVIFTSSSALDLYRGESDLSRRLLVYELPGLSFREYLSLVHDLNFPSLSLEEVLTNHNSISRELTKSFKPIPLFKLYLKEGYFPFVDGISRENIPIRFIKIINTVLESDLAHIQDYNASNIAKIKKLLGVIATSAPFEPNISKIAAKLNLGRNTVNHFLQNLRDAQILNLVNKPAKGISLLQKPDKIYFENSNFAYALQTDPNIGTIRETFFVNQIYHSGHQLNLGKKGDFIVDETITIEVGGKNKENSQIKNVENAYLAMDNIEHGFAHKIPLWLFGFLY